MENNNIIIKNQEEWNDISKNMSHPGIIPWLDLDIETLNKFTEVDNPMLSKIRKLIYGNLKNKKVLCLASGGGQQSAVFSLLGADVTVVDISQEQLNKDIKAAEHYGYKVKTILCSMTDLSVFEAESFDIVIQPVSICYIPDVFPVYKEAYRVLKQGGIYSVSHVNPATYPVYFDNDVDGWDGVGYRIATPYIGGAIRIDEKNGYENMTDGEITGEFRHLYMDMFCNLTEVGFNIKYICEDNINMTDREREPESSIIQGYFDVLSIK